MLIPIGAAGTSYIGWIMAPIVALLLILFVSHWQTIRAYPNNGGAYIVAKDNLGTKVGLLAAAALMIDYVLNVAVGISAGVGALVSAVPVLHPSMLELWLGVLLLITVVNLRGTPDAGRIFALPTYFYVVSFLLVLAIGVGKALASGGHPEPVIAPPPLPPANETVGLWLLLRAFASSCTAMTGVEAVSNGMSAFRDPPVTYGHRTLSGIVAVLGVLLVGIGYLVQAFPASRPPPWGRACSTIWRSARCCASSRSPRRRASSIFRGFAGWVAQDGFLPRPFAIAGWFSRSASSISRSPPGSCSSPSAASPIG